MEKISSDERKRLKDEIETKESKPKFADSAERVQKELKRLKIVNNRENIWDVKLTDTHFVRERESRYGKLKNRMETNGYKWSDSRKDIGAMEQRSHHRDM